MHNSFVVIATVIITCAAQSHSAVLIGGGEAGADATAIFSAIVRLGGGSTSLFCVLGAAAGAGAAGQDAAYCARLSAAGAASCFAVPIDNTPAGRANASDPEVAAQLRACTGYFIIGGDQMNVVESMFTEPAHVPTPALNALRASLSAQGGVVAGTSAGAESQVAGAVIGGGSSYFSILNGMREWSPGDSQNDEPGNLTAFTRGGLGSFDAALVDAHLAQRGRQGRQLRLALDTYALGTPTSAGGHSVGIDENTAFVVERGSGRGTVLGAGGVLVFDVRGAITAGAGVTWTCANASATRLTEGDAVDLSTWTVTPAPFKSPLQGREHHAAPSVSGDVFREGGAQYELVATSLVDSRLGDSTWAATPLAQQPHLNLTFSKVAGRTLAWDGTDPVSGRYAISYASMRVDVAVVAA